jgi:hypothetical protein
LSSEQTTIFVGVIGGAIGAVGAVLSATLPYYFTKRREHQDNLKKTKLERYDELLKKLTAFLENPTNFTGYELVFAYNRATSYATTDVLIECDKFLKGMDAEQIIKNPSTTPELVTAGGQKETVHQRLERNRPHAVQILKAIRKDISPRERDYDFSIYLGRGI